MRAFERARRTITRDPRRGRFTPQEFAKKSEALKTWYFMPAVMVASNWERSRGEHDYGISKRIERLKIRMSQLRTDFLNHKLENTRMRQAAKRAGPPPTSDSDSDDSTYVPPQAAAEAERAPLKSVAVAVPARAEASGNAQPSEEQRVSVFERMDLDQPSTSDGRGARQRSFSPVRGAVYVNSSVRREESWAESESQERSRPRFALAWNGLSRRVCMCCGDPGWVGKCPKFRSARSQ